MSYDSFPELVEQYLSGPSSAMPDALRQRFLDEGSSLSDWDNLTPTDRRSIAEQHDSQNNPALREWRNRITQLTDEIETRQGQIAAWERWYRQNITEPGVKEAKLAALNAEVAALHQQLNAPAGANPVQAQNPAAPAPVETVAPAPLATAPAWSLKKPIRFQGYGKPLYDFLKAAHTSGQPMPKARDLLDAWKTKRPLDVVEVTDNGLKYYDAKGGTKPADLEAIRKAIGRMTR